MKTGDFKFTFASFHWCVFLWERRNIWKYLVYWLMLKYNFSRGWIKMQPNTCISIEWYNTAYKGSCEKCLLLTKGLNCDIELKTTAIAITHLVY